LDFQALIALGNQKTFISLVTSIHVVTVAVIVVVDVGKTTKQQQILAVNNFEQHFVLKNGAERLC
jgi:hypothetical protein